MIASWAHVVKLAAMGLLGFWLLMRWADRSTQDRALRRVLIASYCLRVAIAVGLFAISYWRLPLGASLQRSDGFWVFGLDAWVYNWLGTKIAVAWARGVELPFVDLGIEYFAVVAGLYWLFGSHPLYPILLNCWLGALNSLLAYLIGRRVVDRRVGLLGAVFVGFWPSALLWSSQLLKDTLSWTLVLLVLWLTILVLPAMTRSARPLSLVRECTKFLGLAGAVLLLTRLRFYLGSTVSLAALVTCVPAVVWAARRRQKFLALRYAVIPCLILLVTLYARHLEPEKFLAPRHPERTHYRFAMEAWKAGDVAHAAGEFQQAIALNPRYRKAHLCLIRLQVQQGNLNEALQSYQAYLDGQDHATRQEGNRLMARLFLEQGQRAFAEARFDEAGVSYQHGLMFEPASVVLHEGLAIALATQGKFELAEAALVNALSVISPADAPTLEAVQTRIHLMRQAAIVAPPHLSASVSESATDSRGEVLRSMLKVFSAQLDEDIGQGDEYPVSAATSKHSLVQIREEAFKAATEATPKMLGSIRHDVITGGGYAIMDPAVLISNPKALVLYLPKAMAIGFLAPFPWQWFDTRGGTGFMRIFAGAEILIVYFIFIPGLLVGVWHLLRRREIPGLLLMAYGLATAIPLSLVVANLGTLFRLRLVFLLPLMIVAAAGDPFELYRRLFAKLSHWLRACRPKRAVAPTMALPKTLVQNATDVSP